MDSCLVSHEEYCVFYAMDRALYIILAVELWRNPHECMQIMALWLWFERLGFRNTVQKILSLPRVVINDLADEALVCYRCIRDPQFLQSIEGTNIPLTHSMLKKKISLEYFHENRDTAIGGIRIVVAEICATALADVIGEAIKRHSVQNTLNKQKTLSPAVDQSFVHSFANLGFVNELPKGSSSGKVASLVPEQSLLHNFANVGFAGEMTQGSSRGIWAPLAPGQSLCRSCSNLGFEGVLSNGCTAANMVPSALQQSLSHILAKMGLKGQITGGVAGNVVPPRLARSLGHGFGNLGIRGEFSNGPAQGTSASTVLEQSWTHNFGGSGFGAEICNGISPHNGSAAETRTLFVTFSKGYPVTEAEVREFFTKLFGDCIESFYMQPVMPHEQALYARVVFCKPDIIDLVLNGLQKAKYTINGKHLWMRKFVAKHACASSSSQPLES